jgi:hypothetical protein
MAYDHGMKPPTRSRHYFRLADYSSRIGGFAEHHGSTKLTPRGHPIKATESEGKTFRAGVQFHAARLYRHLCVRPLKRWTSLPIAWRRPEFSEHLPGFLHNGGCPNLDKASQNRSLRA